MFGFFRAFFGPWQTGQKAWSPDLFSSFLGSFPLSLFLKAFSHHLSSTSVSFVPRLLLLSQSLYVSPSLLSAAQEAVVSTALEVNIHLSDDKRKDSRCEQLSPSLLPESQVLPVSISFFALEAWWFDQFLAPVQACCSRLHLPLSAWLITLLAFVWNQCCVHVQTPTCGGESCCVV